MRRTLRLLAAGATILPMTAAVLAGSVGVAAGQESDLGCNGVAHAAWTDFRGRPGVTSANQDVYVASFRS